MWYSHHITCALLAWSMPAAEVTPMKVLSTAERTCSTALGTTVEENGQSSACAATPLFPATRTHQAGRVLVTDGSTPLMAPDDPVK